MKYDYHIHDKTMTNTGCQIIYKINAEYVKAWHSP